MLEPVVDQAAGLTHETHLHRRQLRGGFGKRQPGRAFQAVKVGGHVKVVAHQLLTVIIDIGHALRFTAPQRCQASPGQVVRVDVIGVHVIGCHQHRRAAL